jgi:hypothetical protein
MLVPIPARIREKTRSITPYSALDGLTIGFVSLSHMNIHKIHTAFVEEQAINLPSIRTKSNEPRTLFYSLL